MAFSDYIYIYKNSQNRYNDACNPRFIASHKSCRAIPKEIIDDSSFETIADFLYELNEFIPNTEAFEIIHTTDLKEIYYG